MPGCHRVGSSLTSSAFALVSRSHSPVNSRLASTKSQIITRLGSSETLTNSQNHKVKFQTPRFPEILNSIRKRSNMVENDEKDLDETCRNRGHAECKHLRQCTNYQQSPADLGRMRFTQPTTLRASTSLNCAP